MPGPDFITQNESTFNREGAERTQNANVDPAVKIGAGGTTFVFSDPSLHHQLFQGGFETNLGSAENGGQAFIPAPKYKASPNADTQINQIISIDADSTDYVYVSKDEQGNFKFEIVNPPKANGARDVTTLVADPKSRLVTNHGVTEIDLSKSKVAGEFASIAKEYGNETGRDLMRDLRNYGNNKFLPNPTVVHPSILKLIDPQLPENTPLLLDNHRFHANFYRASGMDVNNYGVLNGNTIEGAYSVNGQLHEFLIDLHQGQIYVDGNELFLGAPIPQGMKVPQ